MPRLRHSSCLKPLDQDLLLVGQLLDDESHRRSGDLAECIPVDSVIQALPPLLFSRILAQISADRPDRVETIVISGGFANAEAEEREFLVRWISRRGRLMPSSKTLRRLPKRTPLKKGLQ